MELLTIKEAAKATRMSPGWWRQRVFYKDVKFLKIGRRVFIPKSTIADILKNAVVEPRPDSNFIKAIG